MNNSEFEDKQRDRAPEGLPDSIMRAFKVYNGDCLSGLYNTDGNGTDYILR